MRSKATSKTIELKIEPKKDDKLLLDRLEEEIKKLKELAKAEKKK